MPTCAKRNTRDLQGREGNEKATQSKVRSQHCYAFDTDSREETLQYMGASFSRSSSKEQRYLTTDEMRQVVNAATGQWKVLWATLAGTGIRVSEAIGLHVEDVDLKSGEGDYSPVGLERPGYHSQNKTRIPGSKHRSGTRGNAEGSHRQTDKRSVLLYAQWNSAWETKRESQPLCDSQSIGNPEGRTTCVPSRSRFGACRKWSAAETARGMGRT